MSKFTNIQFDKIASEKYVTLMQMFERIEQYMIENISNSRERSVAITRLEDTHMWTNKALREDQLSRINGS